MYWKDGRYVIIIPSDPQPQRYKPEAKTIIEVTKCLVAHKPNVA